MKRRRYSRRPWVSWRQTNRGMVGEHFTWRVQAWWDQAMTPSRDRRGVEHIHSKPSERLRCGEPHPHYSSMSCGREPGHDDAHSYGVPSTQPSEPESPTPGDL